MKEVYVSPDVETLIFETLDVIAVSGDYDSAVCNDTKNGDWPKDAVLLSEYKIQNNFELYRLR